MVRETADTLDHRYVFYLFQTSLYNIRIPDESAEETIPTFLTLYIFGVIYEMFLVYDALRLKNTIQVIGLCIYNYALLIYAGIQMTQINDAQHLLASLKDIKLTTWAAVKPFLIAIPCVIAIGSLAMSFVARKLYDEFAWTIYKHISADVKMKRRYLTYQVCDAANRSHNIPNNSPDLHCSSEIRFLLLYWLHHSISCHCCLEDERRIRLDNCCHSGHHYHPDHGWGLYTTREQTGHGYDYREFHLNLERTQEY